MLDIRQTSPLEPAWQTQVPCRLPGFIQQLPGMAAFGGLSRYSEHLAVFPDGLVADSAP
jgi:hypothetical protein